MPTFVHTADGQKTTFNCASSPLPKTVRVNGVPVTDVGTANVISVTVSPAPTAGSIVEILYGPFNGANPLTVPMALTSSYTPVITPVVKYRCAGAESLAYTVDLKSKSMDSWTTTASTDY